MEKENTGFVGDLKEFAFLKCGTNKDVPIKEKEIITATVVK